MDTKPFYYRSLPLTGAATGKPAQAAAKRSPKFLAADTFVHLQPAPVKAASATSTKSVAIHNPHHFAKQVLAAAAQAKGETFDPAKFIPGPPQPPRRMVTAKEILDTARRTQNP